MWTKIIKSNCAFQTTIIVVFLDEILVEEIAEINNFHVTNYHFFFQYRLQILLWKSTKAAYAWDTSIQCNSKISERTNSRDTFLKNRFMSITKNCNMEKKSTRETLKIFYCLQNIDVDFSVYKVYVVYDVTSLNPEYGLSINLRKMEQWTLFCVNE